MTNVTLPLLSAVSRDVRKKHKILGAFTIVGLALSIMSFISFAAVGFTVVATHGEVGMWYAMIPFAGFICGGVTGAVCGTKRASCAAVIDILDRVEQSDKQVIFALASTTDASHQNLIKSIVVKAVAEGLLPDYEIVADKVIAKKSLALHEEEAERLYNEFMTVANPQSVYVGMVAEEKSALPAFCPNCGAPVEGKGKFCQYCGARLTAGGDSSGGE